MAVSTILYLTTVEFGSGAIGKLPDALAGLKLSRPLIVSDPGLKAAGLVEQVAALCPTGSPTFLGVPSNPTEAAVLSALAAYRGEAATVLWRLAAVRRSTSPRRWRCWRPIRGRLRLTRRSGAAQHA